MSSHTNIKGAIQKILDSGVDVSTEDLLPYSVDGQRPDMLISPSTVEEISQVLSLALEERQAVVPWGGGTQMGLGNPLRRGDMALRLSSLDKVREHQPADLTVTVEAGITLSNLQAYLAPFGQHLPLDAPLPHMATIGGVLAANTGGPRSLFYGLARDLLIGIRVIHAGGKITKGGGRVVKNVAGYDMNKLYIGSLGTLGVIVEATFKIAPLPKAEATVIVPLDNLNIADELSLDIRSSSWRPLAMELLSGMAIERLDKDCPADLPGSSFALVVELGGMDKAVARQVEELKGICSTKGVSYQVLEEQDQQKELWRAIRDFGRNEKDVPIMILKKGVLPTDIGKLLEELPPMADRYGLRQATISRAGRGVAYSYWWSAGNTDGMEDSLVTLIGGLRSLTDKLGGTVVVESCPLAVKERVDVWGASKDEERLMRRIKEQFDPKGVLNPGRFVGGL